MSLRGRIQRLEEWASYTVDGALTTDEIRQSARALDIPEEGLLRIFREVIPTRQLNANNMCFLLDAISREYPNACKNPGIINE